MSLLVPLAAVAQTDRVPRSAYGGLHWRLAGPFRGGWATAVSGVPGDPATFYFGSADGGVWKTTDAGVTWQSLFDRQGSASIGALAVAPTDPDVLWVGTGQIHQRWDIVSGDGVYRSVDGGMNWQHLGLTETRHVGALWIDPRDANVVLVAALGHVFGPNPERGVFRTTDGGARWQRVLFVDADTGAVDLAADPGVPDVVYASTWQVRGHPWLDYFQPTVGASSGIHRSTDGGRTWVETGRSGLPETPLGRIELAVVPGTEGRGLWAAVEAEKGGGLYRSDDGGSSWTLVNDDGSLGSSYMAGLVADPSDPQALWAMGRGLRHSTDGGRTFTIVRSSPGGDDYHTMWVDPTDPRRAITGSDQGAVITHNGGNSWSSWYNQPTGQFYRLAVDDAFPYRIYSGQQDSGTVAIASRSDYGQLTFRDWSPVGGDERDGDVPDPTNPDIVYGAGLGGRVSKWNRRTGQVQNVSPWPVSSYAARPGTTRYRYDWITPLAISARPPHAIYVGAQVLFRSRDGGASWETISPDLSGADQNVPACEGDVPVERATECGFGTIFAIAPSPAADGVVWVGTTNGRVHVTRDDGAHWSDVTPPGMQDWTKVNLIDASAADPQTAYVACDRHRADDPRPLIYRTHDGGASWSEIGHGLPPDEWVGVVRADPQQRGLLFAGTRRGVHLSFDDGEHWQSLQLDLPTTGINDLLVHRGDVIVATQGRALWVLDQIAPLRRVAADGVPEAPALLGPQRAVRMRANQNKDTPLPPEEPRGENPPVGAILDYLLAESDEPVTIEILDAAGEAVRTFRSDETPDVATETIYFAAAWAGDPPQPANGAGHHRFVWDLRYPAPPTLESQYSIAALPGEPTAALPLGRFALPGRYRVRLTHGDRVATQALEIVMDPRVSAPPDELEALFVFHGEVERALARGVELARRTTEPAKELAAAVQVLAELATDLGHADAAPTRAQRELLADQLTVLERAGS